jgi:hypothetical protein
MLHKTTFALDIFMAASNQTAEPSRWMVYLFQWGHKMLVNNKKEGERLPLDTWPSLAQFSPSQIYCQQKHIATTLSYLTFKSPLSLIIEQWHLIKMAHPSIRKSQNQSQVILACE